MKVFLSYSDADLTFVHELGEKIRALGAEVLSDAPSLGADRERALLETFGAFDRGAPSWDRPLRDALEAADGLVLVAPIPNAANANAAFFEAGAARALGKPIVVVLPGREPERVGEVSDIHGLAVFDGTRLAPAALAKSIVTTLEAA